MSLFSKLTIKAKLYTLLALFSAGLILQLFALTYTHTKVAINSETYNNIINDKDIIADILPPPLFLVETHGLVYELIQSTNPKRKLEIQQALTELKSQFETRHAFWQSVDIPEAIKFQLLQKSDVAALNYFSVLENSILPLIEKNQNSEAQNLVNNKLTPLFYAHKAEVNKLVEMCDKHHTNTEKNTAYLIQLLDYLGIAMSLVILIICLVFGIRLLKQVLNPLKEVQKQVQLVETGDLTQTVEIKGTDELAQVAQSVNASTTRLRDVLRGISESANTLTASSEELSVAADQVSQSSIQVENYAENVTEQTQSLAEASTKLTTMMGEVNDATSGVAAAVEEMSATISEVSSRCVASSEISNLASQKTHQTKESVQALDVASREISRVVEVINDIAEQTNLLALNAMIEAAGAGEAGKGFAVVAAEVKELAHQSARATEEIAEQIKTMQTNSGRTVVAIGEISNIATEVNEIANAIAAAVEEQTATTREIARNLSHVSQSTSQAKIQVEMLAMNVENVSMEMVQMKDAAQTASRASQETRGNSSHLAQLAVELNRSVDLFKI